MGALQKGRKAEKKRAPAATGREKKAVRASVGEPVEEHADETVWPIEQPSDESDSEEESPSSTDRYGGKNGNGSDFDRLQFGYSPANPEEAAAFHGLFSAKRWCKDRKANYRRIFVEKKALGYGEKHFEHLASWYKLRTHHRSVTNFQARNAIVPRAHASATADTVVSAADDYLKQLQRRQA